MPLTDDQLKLDIASDLSSGDPDQFTDLVARKWELVDDKAYLGSIIRSLYAKRAVIIALRMGQYKQYKWSDADVSEDPTSIFKQLTELLAGVEDEIAEALRLRNGGGVVSGLIAAKTPIEAPPCGPDPSDQFYRGDPVRRWPKRRWL